jgi:hypothetical protein
MSSIPYRTIAIPTNVANAVRETKVSPRYGHPAYTDLASGYGPCRHCLRTFRIGEERRILFTYDPFEAVGDPPLPGPVFIHEAPCDRHPADGGIPEELKAHALTLDAYALHRTLVTEVHVSGQAVEQELQRLLAREEVDYIHVRDASAGCYDFRIEPAPPAC